MRRLAAAILAAVCALFALPAGAARPLLDTHQLDGTFALFARDVLVPWKRLTVRLDTYSGAPVAFSAYAVDPADVIVAGSTSRPRALDTKGRKPVATWSFSPPAGYRFESNDVTLPLQNREGFFVIEARRGDAVQQVWVNLTRIGLILKEAPEGLVLYGSDLGTGRPLGRMRVQQLFGTHLESAQTDASGMLRWPSTHRPAFLLAEWGNSKAFISTTPQSPVPNAVVGIRTDRSIVAAGERVRVAGFARKRSDGVYRVASGEVTLTAIAAGKTLASTRARLDTAGAFSADVALPNTTPAGDVALLASSGGATGGTTVHVDAAGTVALAIAATCAPSCEAGAAVPVRITAKRAGLPAPGVSVAVRVVRSPHVAVPGDEETTPRWGATPVVETSLRTAADGTALVTIPAPGDGLASTYGITASGENATASLRLTLATAPVALAIREDDASLDVGEAASFSVLAFDPVDGRPLPGTNVKVTLSHGPSADAQLVTTGANGRASVTFRTPQLGTSLALAETDAGGKRALDATAVTVAPVALTQRAARASHDVSLTLDKSRYRPGDRVTMNAALSGATGAAFVTLEGARVYDARAIATSGGRVSATLALGNVSGDVRVGVAFVRDGALVYATMPVAIDGPGHPRATALTLEKATYAPGETAKVAIADGTWTKDDATLAIRVSEGQPSGGAIFTGAPAVLASAGTTTQSPAAPDPSWHAWVAPRNSKALDIFSADRPRGEAPPASVGVADARPVVWNVERASPASSVSVRVPAQRGRYILSVLKVADDGDVGAASTAIVVQ